LNNALHNSIGARKLEIPNQFAAGRDRGIVQDFQGQRQRRDRGRA